MKMKHLEDKNKVLDMRLKILRDQGDYKGNLDNIVRQLENELQQQVDGLIRDRAKLESEVFKNQAEVDQTKRRSAEVKRLRTVRILVGFG